MCRGWKRFDLLSGTLGIDMELYTYKYKEKYEEIWLSPITKGPTPTGNSKKQHDNKNNSKNLNYTTIANRFRTVSWSNDSHLTGVVKQVYIIPTFPLTAKVV